MRHTLPIIPQFYVTAPQPCPYLDGRTERKLFTALQPNSGTELNNALSKQGFRRSQNVLYRPACLDCAQCYSARIRVADFRPSRGQKRILRRNRGLERRMTSPWATEEQFAIFRRYLDSRHANGGMADMDIFEFAAMVEETLVQSQVVEYFGTEDGGQAVLMASSLTDILDDGLSMVYSFFEPVIARHSPGTYMVLDHVRMARELGLKYVYLGYWVPGSPKMGYKSSFSALEIFRGNAWVPLDGALRGDGTGDHPASHDTIAAQVAAITLPDRLPTGRQAPAPRDK